MAAPDPALPVERFPALTVLSNCVHGFVTRVAGIDARHDKAEALRRLDAVHRSARVASGIGAAPLASAEQVHGNQVQIIDQPLTEDRLFERCDGLITNQLNTCLAIYVADCCAVYLVDPVRSCIGLAHSGRKGTELDIVGRAIGLMSERFGSKPEDLVMQLSPCIRPPNYEVDFAAEILHAGRARGVKNIHDAGVCTASDLKRYYSYRAEKGKTGRMLAFLALTATSSPA